MVDKICISENSKVIESMLNLFQSEGILNPDLNFNNVKTDLILKYPNVINYLNAKQSFPFNPNTAPICIVGSSWMDKPENSQIVYQNNESMGKYGDFMGYNLSDIFYEIQSSRNNNSKQDLLKILINEGRLANIKGTLSGILIDLYSHYNSQQGTIQSTIIDATTSYYDKLTGLLNRDLFFNRLDNILLRAKREKKIISVYFLDLDGFKGVNDTYGHDGGNVILKETANRLKSSLQREHETIGRLGGDEFGVILEGTNETNHKVVANNILNNINLPYKYKNSIISNTIGISIGIATYPIHSKDADSLVNAADDAMYIAKKKGKGTWVVYDKSMKNKNI